VSKFHDLESYVTAEQYNLLPFKFDRLNDREYILTNMVGEFYIISSSKLEVILEHRLSKDDSDYASLRAKHFICLPNENAPIELLALKLRTKLARLANFTNLHLFVVSLRCDHSCPYCQVSRQSEDKAAFDMTEQTGLPPI
jgi:hypothetical protein